MHHKDFRCRRFLLCKCICGNEKVIQASLISSGNTKSCGCLIKKSSKNKRLPNDGGVVNHIILQYKRHAKDRDIQFLLSREEVDFLIRLPCYYCGEKSGNLKKTKNCKEGFLHNGIDRKSSKLPYVQENCVPCCGICNKAKGIRSEKEFVLWAKKIAMAEQWG